MKKNLKKTFLCGQDEDTICALSTPPGESALALVRLSGKKAFEISKKVCPFLPQKIQSHRIYFGTFLHPETAEALDEVLVFCFEEGRSFTGEESVEISCHGGSYISSVILESLLTAGARPAEKGEFSYRSFMNGKMDLLQAENVLHLIQSRSPKGHEQALKGLKGQLSGQLKSLETKILRLLSHQEASIDFSDQEIEPFSVSRQKEFLKEIKQEVEETLKGFQQGRINREGFCVLLLGAPNAGKSSLFNYLVQDDKAIVTEYPGTTRDILSARILLNHREFCLKDSAGFRKNPDPVEEKGIQKTLEEIDRSDLCLFLLESVLPLNEESFFGLEKSDPEKTFVVFSKSDRLPLSERQPFLQAVRACMRKRQGLSEDSGNTRAFLQIRGGELFDESGNKNKPFLEEKKSGENILWLSAFTGEGMETLNRLLHKNSEKSVGEIFLSTPRQFAALDKIKNFLTQAEKLLNKHASPEFTAFELQSALSVLYELLGREYNEEVIQQIFKEFCIGK